MQGKRGRDSTKKKRVGVITDMRFGREESVRKERYGGMRYEREEGGLSCKGKGGRDDRETWLEERERER